MTTCLPGSNYSSPVRFKAGDSRNQKSRTEVHGEARVPWPASPRLVPTQGRAGICKTLCLAYTLRVKRAPKPDPVKPRLPAGRRFHFVELAVPLVYIFVSSHVLANVAKAAPVPGYRRDPPRRFVFSSSAASIAPPGCHRFHLDRNVPQCTPVIGSSCPVQQAWHR
jgi:hypothetical protein